MRGLATLGGRRESWVLPKHLRFWTGCGNPAGAVELRRQRNTLHRVVPF